MKQSGFYNGDGREEKRAEKNYAETSPGTWQWVNEPLKYFIRSTVLGGEVLSDVKADGSKGRTYVRAAGSEIAWQNSSGSSAEVVFQHNDAAGTSYRTTSTSGNAFTDETVEGGPAELDPLGGNVGKENPYLQQVPGNGCEGCQIITDEMPNYVLGQPLTYNRDGMNVPASIFLMLTEGRTFDQLRFQMWKSVEVIRWERSWWDPRTPTSSHTRIMGEWFTEQWHFSLYQVASWRQIL